MSIDGSQEFPFTSREVKTYPNGIRGKKLSIGFPPVNALNQRVPEMLEHDPSAIVSDFNGMNIERLRQQQNALTEAKTVIYNTMIGSGLGDSIISLRYASIAARHFLDKKFYVPVNSQILGIDRDLLNIPSNVTLIGEDGHVDYDPSTTFALKILHGYENLDESRISRDSAIEEQVAMSTLGVSTNNAIDADTPFTRTDFADICQLVSLGVPVTQTDLETSILKTSEPREKKYDIVIAPDAKEMSNGAISKKSLSPAEWNNIFREIAKSHPSAKIGIIQGVAHPDYCHIVSEFAKKAGLIVTEEATPTLTDFLRVLEQTSTFLGMDSGTTHLANELALASPHFSVKEIFFSNSMSLITYGIRGPRTQIFYFLGNNLPADFPADLEVATNDIAEFIAA